MLDKSSDDLIRSVEKAMIKEAKIPPFNAIKVGHIVLVDSEKKIIDPKLDAGVVVATGTLESLKQYDSSGAAYDMIQQMPKAKGIAVKYSKLSTVGRADGEYAVYAYDDLQTYFG